MVKGRRTSSADPGRVAYSPLFSPAEEFFSKIKALSCGVRRSARWALVEANGRDARGRFARRDDYALRGRLP